MIWSAVQYGLIGPGFAWLISHAIYFVLWVPVVHQRFAPGLHWAWLSRDVLLPITLPTFFVLLVYSFFEFSQNRITLSFELMGLTAILVALGFPLADKAHNKYFSRLRIV